jgi:hypothetical protein
LGVRNVVRLGFGVPPPPPPPIGCQLVKRQASSLMVIGGEVFGSCVEEIEVSVKVEYDGK